MPPLGSALRVPRAGHHTSSHLELALPIPSGTPTYRQKEKEQVWTHQSLADLHEITLWCPVAGVSPTLPLL